jgi:NAD+ synthase
VIKIALDYNEVSIIIKDFIKTYVGNSGCKGVIIGLSGGVDSAVTAVLCRQALGKKKTNCLFMPDDVTPESDIKHQKIIVEKFDLLCETKNITKIVKNTVDNCFVKPDKMALANMKARIRMTLLFEYANMTGSLVCGTSNKSELLVGYFTKYGDGGADIMPIGDLYKTQIYELAKFLKIPKEIISKAPTAGLIKDQTDEKELGYTYGILDKVLMGLERKQAISDMVKNTGLKKSDVEKIKNMRVKSEHKRHSPLIPKIGVRTPGLDWRSPITTD